MLFSFWRRKKFRKYLNCFAHHISRARAASTKPRNVVEPTQWGKSNYFPITSTIDQ